jgi:2-polyprenyl-6-methoxyphenol hydroxylase-like FAD-dependent oxidoreductase
MQTQMGQAKEVGVPELETIDCCIVGGGPAGAVLALLLARQGVPVLLLEEHKDFDRDFRGDTIHPSVLQIMEEIGLAGRLLQLRHTEMHTMSLEAGGGTITPVDFRRLKTRYPYVMMVPQVEFLNFITAEAARYPQFHLRMNARVEELIEEDGVIRGVRYRGPDGRHEVRARLTVGADGRFSRLRKLAGLPPIASSPPMDVLWFRLPRQATDAEEAGVRFGTGRLGILLHRFDYWQVGYVIAKGTYQQIRAAGIEAFRRQVAELFPELRDRVAALHDWKGISLLSVESSRLARWYRPGLLLIGDAAHVMTPIGGVGINYAIQDAVVAANVLGPRFHRGKLRLRDLAAIQQQREWPTRIIQAFQATVQQHLLGEVLQSAGQFQLPRIARILLGIPLLRNLPARFIAFGVWPVHVKGAPAASTPHRS